MTRASRWLLAVLALGFPLPAIAQPKGGTPPLAGSTTTEAQTKEQIEAQQHFQRAKDLYQAGSYREAVAELDAARALDPKAKDLVFNLGIVHEKLQRYDEAISDFRLYMEMDGVTAKEKEKAESIIKRIEGAKREVPTTTPTSTASGRGTTAPPTTPPEQPNGRIDAATIGAAGLGAVGLAVGTTFGILALTTRPSNFVTGRDGTYDDLVTKTNNAHAFAVVSDVGFALGTVGALAAVWLYFTRPKAGPVGSGTPPASPHPILVPGPGWMVLRGSFR
jgi:uncharacterized protein (UPF0332 family)